MKKGYVSLVVVLAFIVSACAGTPEVIGEIEYGFDPQSQQVVVAWETTADARSQVVYGPGDDYGFATEEQIGTTHYHILTEAVPGTSYNMIVRVVDMGGEELISEALLLTAPALASPQTLKQVSRASGARIAWEAPFGASAYIVERASEAAGPFEELVTTSETVYVDQDVAGGQTHYYRVTSLDAHGEAAAPSDAFRVDVSSAVVADDFSTGFDEAVWSIYDNRNAGGAPAAVRDGQLIFENFHTNGWDENQGGVVLNEPLDLVGKTTTIEIEYAEFGWTELNPGFFGERVQADVDIFDLIGFRLTVEGADIDTRISHGGDGQFNPNGKWGAPELPYTLTWVLTHLDGKQFAHQVFLDGALAHEGQVQIGSIDPAALYFYLWVANDTTPGPRSAVNSVLITQE